MIVFSCRWIYTRKRKIDYIYVMNQNHIIFWKQGYSESDATWRTKEPSCAFNQIANTAFIIIFSYNMYIHMTVICSPIQQNISITYDIVKRFLAIIETKLWIKSRHCIFRILYEIENACKIHFLVMRLRFFDWTTLYSISWLKRT